MGKQVVTVLVLVLGLVSALGLGLYFYGRGPVAAKDAASVSEKKATYQCSMHPQIVSDEPGICPICQMKLSRVDEVEAADGVEKTRADEHASGSQKKATYQCSMHPQIVSDRPGICPICQMKLSRVEDVPEDGESGKERASPKDRKVKFYRHPMRADVVSPTPAKDEMGMDYIPVYDDAETAETSVPGHASFAISTERQQLIGVTKAPVARRPLEAEINAVGRVAYDPALYQAIVEYREAMRSRGALSRSDIPEAQSASNALLRGAHLRLRQQGLSDAQIQELTKTMADPVELLLPGDAVWVYAQVYEYEAPLVAPGQAMVVTAPSHPGREFVGTVAAVDPILDPMTRTVRVRARIPTPEKSLRPESFVKVAIHVPLGEKLAIRQEAVLDTGAHQIVFVAKGKGTFEPRSVTVGREAQGYYEVLSGLEPGEEVVTSANFLIDSESRFRAALAAFKAAPAEPR